MECLSGLVLSTVTGRLPVLSLNRAAMVVLKLNPLSLKLFVRVVEDGTIATAAAREHIAAARSAYAGKRLCGNLGVPPSRGLAERLRIWRPSDSRTDHTRRVRNREPVGAMWRHVAPIAWRRRAACSGNPTHSDRRAASLSDSFGHSFGPVRPRQRNGIQRRSFDDRDARCLRAPPRLSWRQVSFEHHCRSNHRHGSAPARCLARWGMPGWASKGAAQSARPLQLRQRRQAR